MQTYVINRLTECYAAEDLAEYNRIIQSAFVMSVAICSVGAVFMLVLIWSAPVSSWLRLEDLPPAVLKGALQLMSLQVIAAVPLNLTLGIYRSFGEFHRGVMVSNAQRAATLLATGAVLLLKGSMVAAAGIQCIPVVLTFLFAAADIKGRYPAIRLVGGQWSLAMCRKLISPSLLFFGSQAAYIAALQGGPLILAATVGPVGVATYVTLRTLANVIRQIAQSLRFSMWPEITKLAASGQWGVVRELQQKSARLLLAFSGSTAVFFFMAGKWLVPFWTRNRVEFEAGTLLPLLLISLFEGWWGSSALVLMATNRIKAVTVCYSFSAVISLLLGFLLVRLWGTSGMAVGAIIGDLATSAWYLPRQVVRLLNENGWAFVRDSWVPFVFVTLVQVAVLLAIPLYAASMKPMGKVLAMGAATAVIWCMLYPLIIWRGNTAREFARVWSKLSVSA